MPPRRGYHPSTSPFRRSTICERSAQFFALSVKLSPLSCAASGAASAAMASRGWEGSAAAPLCCAYAAEVVARIVARLRTHRLRQLIDSSPSVGSEQEPCRGVEPKDTKLTKVRNAYAFGSS